ncbi:hypothetical protein PMIN03_007806 [Paraphaeosphaeria minitans]
MSLQPADTWYRSGCVALNSAWFDLFTVCGQGTRDEVGSSHHGSETSRSSYASLKQHISGLKQEVAGLKQEITGPEQPVSDAMQLNTAPAPLSAGPTQLIACLRKTVHLKYHFTNLTQFAHVVRWACICTTGKHRGIHA